MRTPFRYWVAMTAALLLLAGCAGLPTSDRVEAGGPVMGQPQQNVRVLPAAPDPGADPVQIVGGFLRANPGFQDEHETAQSYLTEALQSQWRPTQAVTIYDGEFRTTQLDTDRVEISVNLRGQLDTDGNLTEAPAGTPWRGVFGLVESDGEWRISSFPDDFGLLLSVSEFSTQYTLRPITYLSTVREEYILERRWFPNYASGGLATALTRAQMQPVPSYLSGAVDHGFPAQSEIAGAGVPVDPGTYLATVELNLEGITISDERMTSMWIQLAHTLTQSSSVNQVSLQSNGYPLAVPGIDDSLGDPVSLGYAEAELRVAYALLRLRDQLQPVIADHFRLADYTFGADEAGPELPVIGLSWLDMATDAEVSEFAGVSYDRTQLARWYDGQETVMTAIGTMLTAPSYDRIGGLWVAGQSTQGPAVWWIDQDADPAQVVARRVDAGWLSPGQQIAQFRVGPDDTRALIVVRDPATGIEQLGMSAIVRDDTGRPTSVTEPRWIAPTLEAIRSVSWMSADEVFILGRRADDTLDTPYRLPIGGWLVPFDTVELARAVRGGTDINGLEIRIVLNQQGRIFTPEGQSSWDTQRNGDEVIIPGY